VVLTGVNITSYRDPAAPRTGLAELIERILSDTGRLRLRLSSLEPEMITGRLLSALAAPRVQPHFHIPVQSGSDRILATVRRPYKADRVRRAVADLRSVKEEPFIAADIIAGLPGEGEEDFRASFRLLEECRFSALHVFPFSPRPGTESEHAGGRVPERVIGERAAALRQLGERLQADYLSRWRGREVEAVLEKRLSAESEAPIGSAKFAEPPAAVQPGPGAADGAGGGGSESRPAGSSAAGQAWSALSANYLHLTVHGVPADEGQSGALCRVRLTDGDDQPNEGEAGGETAPPADGHGSSGIIEGIPAAFISSLHQ
jgi:hypothetical protein